MKTPGIRISPATGADVADLVSELRGPGGEVPQVISSTGFNGVQEVVLLISALGGPLLVKHAASAIVAWIRKNDKRSVIFGKVKINGYSAKEVESLLKTIDKK